MQNCANFSRHGLQYSFCRWSNPAAKARPKDKARLPRQGTETILLAEDDSIVREFHKTLFESAGYTVITACHGMEAFEKFVKHEQEIDLLVFDVIMPRIKAKRPLGTS